MTLRTRSISLLLLCLVMPVVAAAADVDNKKALAARVLELWHVENIAIGVFQQTGAEVLRKTAGAVRGRLTAEQQQAVLEGVTIDVKAYMDGLLPYVTESAQSVKQTVFMPFLLENFDEQELEELIRILESPAKKKLDELLPAVQVEYEQQVVTASSDRVKPALDELTKTINGRLQQAAGSP